jgi:hypothetical protein
MSDEHANLRGELYALAWECRPRSANEVAWAIACLEAIDRDVAQVAARLGGPYDTFSIALAAAAVIDEAKTILRALREREALERRGVRLH